MADREYELTCEGELGDRVVQAFEGATAVSLGGRTMLVGTVRDQAELQGLLQRVSSLGLTLVSARLTGGEERRPADSRSHG